MRRKTFPDRTARPMRIDDDLGKRIKDFAVKNDMSLREASKEIAKVLDGIKGKKIIREIEF